MSSIAFLYDGEHTVYCDVYNAIMKMSVNVGDIIDDHALIESNPFRCVGNLLGHDYIIIKKSKHQFVIIKYEDYFDIVAYEGSSKLTISEFETYFGICRKYFEYVELFN